MPQKLNELDKWVWARIPDESIANGFLQDKVLKFMILKPCGHFKVNSACMQLKQRHQPQEVQQKVSPTVQEYRNHKRQHWESWVHQSKNDNDRPTVKVTVDGKSD